MNLKDEFDPIRDWAFEKQIFDKASQETQFLKLMEEVGELSEAMQEGSYSKFVDAIGDCVVVLTILAKMKGFNIEHCINSVYAIISKREGKIVNGVFVKENNK